MVILINAKRGHGKDQYCQYMIQALKQKGKHAQRRAFADTLKEFTDDLYQRLKPFFKDRYQFDKLDNSIKQVRQGMEFGRAWWLAVGTYVKKYFGHLTWVQSLMDIEFEKKYFYYPQCFSNYAIITDMRFFNQYQFVKSHRHSDKIKMVRIWRPGQHPIAGHMGTTQTFVNDKSQIDLDKVPKQNWDRFVLNDKGLQDLRKDAYNFVDILIK